MVARLSTPCRDKPDTSVFSSRNHVDFGELFGQTHGIIKIGSGCEQQQFWVFLVVRARIAASDSWSPLNSRGIVMLI